MKLLKGFGIVIMTLITLFILGICCYGFGEDLLAFLPLWLSKVILGAVFLVIGTIVVIIFALGLLKIKETFRDNS